MDKQPEALRLAQVSEELAADGALLHCWPWPSLAKLYQENAAELRRQHALIAELVEALNSAKEVLMLEGYREDGPTIFDIDVALSKAKEQ